LEVVKTKDEDKLLTDISQAVGLNDVSDEHEKASVKSKLFKEVKDLEGYAASLSQTGGLDPAKHRVIAMALERGLLKRLHIDGDKMKPIEVDEENLLKDSEEFYVNKKFTQAKGDIERLRSEKGEGEALKRSIELMDPMVKALPLRRSEIEKLSNVVRNQQWMKTESKR